MVSCIISCFQNLNSKNVRNSKKAASKNKVVVGCDLPAEFPLLELFGQLNAKDLVRCGQVCQAWHRVANDSCLWKNLLLKDFNYQPGGDPIAFKQAYQKRFRILSNHLNPKRCDLIPLQVYGRSYAAVCTTAESIILGFDKGVAIVDLKAGSSFFGTAIPATAFPIKAQATLKDQGVPLAANDLNLTAEDNILVATTKAKNLFSIWDTHHYSCLFAYTNFLSYSKGKAVRINAEHGIEIWDTANKVLLYATEEKIPEKISFTKLIGDQLIIALDSGKIYVFNYSFKKCCYKIDVEGPVDRVIISNSCIVYQKKGENKIHIHNRRSGGGLVKGLNYQINKHLLPESLVHHIENDLLIVSSPNNHKLCCLNLAGIFEAKEIEIDEEVRWYTRIKDKLVICSNLKFYSVDLNTWKICDLGILDPDSSIIWKVVAEDQNILCLKGSDDKYVFIDLCGDVILSRYHSKLSMKHFPNNIHLRIDKCAFVDGRLIEYMGGIKERTMDGYGVLHGNPELDIFIRDFNVGKRSALKEVYGNREFRMLMNLNLK